jgi:hypothetical protein
MECDYACFNHNSLVSPKREKKSDHQGLSEYKGGFLYNVP